MTWGRLWNAKPLAIEGSIPNLKHIPYFSCGQKYELYHCHANSLITSTTIVRFKRSNRGFMGNIK